MSDFRSVILVVPGLGNSGENHWQTLWENEFSLERIQQEDWDTPTREDWIRTIDEYVAKYDPANVILIGHSLACNAIVAWADKYRRKIKAALLVAPSDTEAPSYPTGTKGFTPMPLSKLQFPSLVVSSSNDFYVTPDRAKFFAAAWGSDFQNVGDAGHINVASDHGPWREGLALLISLDKH